MLIFTPKKQKPNLTDNDITYCILKKSHRPKLLFYWKSSPALPIKVAFLNMSCLNKDGDVKLHQHQKRHKEKSLIKFVEALQPCRLLMGHEAAQRGHGGF